jgi:hypothetical protein
VSGVKRYCDNPECGKELILQNSEWIHVKSNPELSACFGNARPKPLEPAPKTCIDCGGLGRVPPWPGSNGLIDCKTCKPELVEPAAPLGGEREVSITENDLQIVQHCIELGKDDGDIASIHIERLQALLDGYISALKPQPTPEVSVAASEARADLAVRSVRAFMFCEQSNSGRNPHRPMTNKFLAFELGMQVLKAESTHAK